MDKTVYIRASLLADKLEFIFPKCDFDLPNAEKCSWQVTTRFIPMENGQKRFKLTVVLNPALFFQLLDLKVTMDGETTEYNNVELGIFDTSIYGPIVEEKFFQNEHIEFQLALHFRQRILVV